MTIYNPTITNSNINNRFVFVRRGDNAIWYSAHIPGTYTFNSWNPLGGILTSKPVTTVFQNNALIFARGGDNGIWYRKYDVYNNSWSQWASLGGIILSFPIVAQNCIDKMFLFCIGTDNQLYYKSTSDSINWDINWRRLGGILLSEPACILYQNTNIWKKQLYTFHICGQPQSCCYNYSSDYGNTWNGLQPLGYPSSSVSFTTDTPTTSVFDNILYIFCKGTDNAIYYKRFDSYNWDSNWQYLGGYLTSSPISLMFDRDNAMNRKLFIAHRGGDSAAYVKTFDGSSWYPSGSNNWIDIDGILPGDPVISADSKRLYIFHRGRDNAVYYKSTYDGISWDSNWTSLGGPIQDDPAVK